MMILEQMILQNLLLCMRCEFMLIYILNEWRDNKNCPNILVPGFILCFRFCLFLFLLNVLVLTLSFVLGGDSLSAYKSIFSLINHPAPSGLLKGPAS